jgi:hypothetical protein
VVPIRIAEANLRGGGPASTIVAEAERLKIEV